MKRSEAERALMEGQGNIVIKFHRVKVSWGKNPQRPPTQMPPAALILDEQIRQQTQSQSLIHQGLAEQTADTFIDPSRLVEHYYMSEYMANMTGYNTNAVMMNPAAFYGQGVQQAMLNQYQQQQGMQQQGYQHQTQQQQFGQTQNGPIGYSQLTAMSYSVPGSHNLPPSTIPNSSSITSYIPPIQSIPPITTIPNTGDGLLATPIQYDNQIIQPVNQQFSNIHSPSPSPSSSIIPQSQTQSDGLLGAYPQALLPDPVLPNQQQFDQDQDQNQLNRRRRKRYLRYYDEERHDNYNDHNRDRDYKYNLNREGEYSNTLEYERGLDKRYNNDYDRVRGKGYEFEQESESEDQFDQDKHYLLPTRYMTEQEKQEYKEGKIEVDDYEYRLTGKGKDSITKPSQYSSDNQRIKNRPNPPSSDSLIIPSNYSLNPLTLSFPTSESFSKPLSQVFSFSLFDQLEEEEKKETNKQIENILNQEEQIKKSDQYSTSSLSDEEKFQLSCLFDGEQLMYDIRSQTYNVEGANKLFLTGWIDGDVSQLFCEMKEEQEKKKLKKNIEKEQNNIKYGSEWDNGQMMNKDMNDEYQFNNLQEIQDENKEIVQNPSSFTTSQAVRAGHIITKSAKSGISLLASASSFTPSLSSVWSILESDGWGGSGASMLAAGEGADILLRLQQQQKKKSNLGEKGDEGIEYELEYEDIFDKKKSNICGIFSGEDYISSFILGLEEVWDQQFAL
ncbi:MAG: hypothetical protein EZS28_024248 [Streblomastix strix]|uniref:Uncharacterized protein n=1 Tax=Streblomastix strix TaxID=222440 RepID=A0A5J4VCQ0_9EUKA|nr:MAG: hypothetical protein EZS28_024248 [Streblomastix strix]